MINLMDPIKIPRGIRYLGNWEEFKFSRFPNKCIINKELPGCGFTEYCLNSDENVILTSPRIMLINNKADQHQDVFLVVNDMDKDPNVDKDLTQIVKDHSVSKTQSEIDQEKLELEENSSRNFNRIKHELSNYVNWCFSSNKPIKILVTYDSYHIVKDILTELSIFSTFYTVIDEFQSILHDARFKSDTELQFLSNLKESHSALFVSATPMLEEYLNMLSEFDGLPYYKLDWGADDSTRIVKPNLDVKLMRSAGEKICQVAKTYLDGEFVSVVVNKGGNPVKVTSTEAVFYVNSVNHITSVIKKLDLSPSQVLILCSNTKENQAKIKRKLGSRFSIGHVPNPKKGETFPMFTFCTRTVYLGADFYSTCARTFVFSDSNSDCLAVDISEDLPQILGRQRLDENPWRNSATFYYRTTADYRTMTKKDFDNKINIKKKQTENLLSVYDKGDTSEKTSLALAYQKLAKSYNYKDDYVGVTTIINESTGDKILKPKWNNLVLVNEIRAYNIQQIDYKDRFSVFNAVNTKISHNIDTINIRVADFFQQYDLLTTRYDKLKLLCEYGLSTEELDLVLSQLQDNDDVKSFYTSLGPKRLKELGYNITYIKKDLNIVTFSKEKLVEEIDSSFNIGDKLLLSEIKQKLSEIYSKLNYKKSPKAIDILEYFEVKEYKTTITTNNVKKRVRGYELISKK